MSADSYRQLNSKGVNSALCYLLLLAQNIAVRVAVLKQCVKDFMRRTVCASTRDGSVY